MLLKNKRCCVRHSYFSEINMKYYTLLNWNFNHLLPPNLHIPSIKDSENRNIAYYKTRFWLQRGGLLWSNHWHESISRKLESNPRRWTACCKIKACPKQSGYKLLMRDIFLLSLISRKFIFRCSFSVEWVSASNCAPILISFKRILRENLK